MQDTYNQVNEYIRRQLSAGVPVNEIIIELRNSGWEEPQIQQFLTPYISSTQQTPQSINNPIPTGYVQQPQTHAPASKLKAVVIGGVAFLLLIIGIAVAVALTQNSNNPESEVANADNFTQLTDPNFTMLLPKTWTSDAAYKPGALLVLNYSPADGSTDSELKAAKMVMYIDSDPGRIDQQIENVGQSEVEIVKDESFEVNGTNYRYVELTVALEGTPDLKRHVATVTAQRGDLVINADVTGLEDHWYLHAENVETMLKSITPACDKKVELTDEQRFSAEINLCGG